LLADRAEEAEAAVRAKTGGEEDSWEVRPTEVAVTTKRHQTAASRAAARRNAKSAQVQAARSAADLSEINVNDNGLRGRRKRNADVSGTKHKRYSKKNKRGTAD
jgi:hypothetical protein